MVPSNDNEALNDYRTPTGLRRVLADNLAGLRSHEITPATANATTNTVGKVMQTYKMQIDYAKHIGEIAYLPELQTTRPV